MCVPELCAEALLYAGAGARRIGSCGKEAEGGSRSGREPGATKEGRPELEGGQLDAARLRSAHW